ncbi:MULTISPECIES: branched-chain amino acid ABC transporter permease [Carnobacterium]|uniref:Amino acid/amide ABC transporter membrane protein 1, HAAT family n=1 Tax=Carnobacterium alterfunditum TaxID=28230 RepID=A0A1N6HQE9_9LACT|nr:MULTISPECIES: branched-chain amino acid ABC transporter permease [Carnobacterium]MBT2732933.1 branched-chain amino acid ABC transporter permease [Carnobacterium sp. ISL-102]SIO21991.1 amino acid/amide ABC transporter membrane protein 1, HAAT family [Carnobacterium alterfunditum]
MEAFLQQLINGLSLGSIYALIALGYTMVYGIIKLINFAHGDIYMVGAFVGYTAINSLKLSFLPAMILSMVFCAVLGVAIERIAYKPLRNATRVAALITAIGMSYLLQNGMIYLVGSETRAFPQVIENNIYEFAGLQVSQTQILIFGTTIILMLALQLIVQKTKMGKAMRAVSTDADAARLMGINVDNVISFTFALGSSLAGAAGVLVGLYYNSIEPMMGYAPGLKAFIAAVLGGIGIIPGAMFGGFTIGIIETLVSGYGGSMIKDAVVYLILIIILIFKPSGLLGKNVKEKV